ncbi:MAG: radical SAM/SPASM domain-containing protein [Bacteroidetes bacterium GWA2_32_17]|nr:MAG: radical SAM/SPASM domain-containing protein [Bacteroidetes bacterium GWA2_32_17]
MRVGFKKKIALELFRKYKKNQAKLHVLNYLFWECTLKCNLNCLHCGSDCTKSSDVKDMPFEDFIGVIDKLTPTINPNKTMIVITGGEPLVRKDIEKCGMELYKRGYPWGLVTNGLLLTKERFSSLINSGLSSITVSLDGFEESHNWLRNNNKSFKSAYEAAKLLANTQNLKYDVVTCVNKKNFSELNTFKELLISIGIKEWRIFTIFPTGRAKNNEQLQLSAKQFKELFDFIKQIRIENKIKLNYGCEGFLGEYEGDVRDNFFICGAGINTASVLIDGSISACPSLRNNFIQGNIYNDDFVDVWNNRYQKYRDRSWTKIGICADCESFKYCEGNGLHLRDEKTNELAFCHLKRIEEGDKV